MEFKKKEISLSSVHFYNETVKALKLRVDDIKPVLDKFLNKKIRLSDSNKSLTSVFNKALPETDYSSVNPLNAGDHVSIHISRLSAPFGTLWLKISLCFNGGSSENKTYYCVYKDIEILLGKIDEESGILTEINNNSEYFKNMFELIDFENECLLINEYNQTLAKLINLEREIKIKS